MTHADRPIRAALSAVALASVALALTLAIPVQAQTTPAKAAGRSGGPVLLNFPNTDIEAVTRAMAAMIGRQILVDPRVKGTITLYSDTPMSVRDAYQNYQSALRGLGFSVVDSGGLLKVVPEAEAKLQTGVVSVGAPSTRGEQVITQIFRLSHENPNNLVAVLRPLISPNNTINANPGNNTLVITDYADNLTRLGKIIAALDQPAASEVEVVPLQYAIASDMAALVQRLGDGSSSVSVPGVATVGALTVLADSRSNALILRAANPGRLASVRALIERLDRPGIGGPAGSIYVVHLKNADAAKLATVLRAAFGGGGAGGSGSGGLGGAVSAPNPISAGVGIGGIGGVGGVSAATATPVSASAQPSTGGFIQADAATNSLVITAPEPLYRQIRTVIDQLDGRRAQVFVESMIVEMDASKAAEFGFQWQGLLGRNGDRVGLVAGTNFGTSGNILSLTAAGASGGTAVTSTLTGVPGLNLGLLQKINGVYTLAALARFLETVSGTNILSTPNLVALDNEEAKIVVGSNVPFVTGSFTNTGSSSATVNPFQTIERKDVGLTLRIKPQIGEGGVIRMTVYQENSSVVDTTKNSSNGPTTNKSSIETTVVVDDGAIMVLGGQLKDQYDGSANKVPFFGDMPLVGNLFRNDSRVRTKTNLLVFLRPVVIRDSQAAASLTLDRYDLIRAQQLAAQPEPSRLTPINEAPLLPALPALPGGGTAKPVPPSESPVTPVVKP